MTARGICAAFRMGRQFDLQRWCHQVARRGHRRPAIASAQAPFDSTLITVALPSIRDGIGADSVPITGLPITGYLVVNVVCQCPAGRISDLVGHSRVLWAGIGLYVIGAAFGLLAQGVSLLFVSRCTMAAAGALVVPATLALLR